MNIVYKIGIPVAAAGLAIAGLTFGPGNDSQTRVGQPTPAALSTAAPRSYDDLCVPRMSVPHFIYTTQPGDTVYGILASEDVPEYQMGDAGKLLQRRNSHAIDEDLNMLAGKRITVADLNCDGKVGSQ